MKIKTTLIFFLMLNLLQAQDLKLHVLITQLPYSNKAIEAKFENGKIYYFNKNTSEKLFLTGFDIAYPFFLKSAIVKQNGKYGIIDKNGDYLIKPIYNDFELAPYEHESYIVIFNDDVVFNLDRGLANASYTICEEPASPELYAFAGKNKKYGVKQEDGVLIKPIYDTIYAVEPKFVMASKNKKIGVVDLKNNTIIDFKYDESQYSEDREFDYTYSVFGLRKNHIWTYFDSGQKILESEYKCDSFLTLLENTIGVFNFKGKQNILFKNGKTLNKYYDFVSKNGLVGTVGNKVFEIKGDGSDVLYYQEK